MNNKQEQIANNIYKNRKKLMRYFVTAIALTTARYLVSTLLSGLFSLPTPDADLIAWLLWGIAFYPALKFFVYKTRAKHIYALMTQIIFYIFGASAVWLANQILTGALYMFSNSPAAATALGGGVAEVLCLIIMNKVFKDKGKNV